MFVENCGSSGLIFIFIAGIRVLGIAGDGYIPGTTLSVYALKVAATTVWVFLGNWFNISEFISR